MTDTSRPIIVISEFMEEFAVTSLAAKAATLHDPGLVDRPEALRTALANARVLIVRNRTRVDAALLDAAPHLEHVGRLGVGLDNIDLEACRARGIAVHPATGANDDAVAEYVVAATLVLLRPAFLGTMDVRSGAWPRDRSIGHEIAGRIAGLIGFGRTARKTAARLAALGMKIMAHDPAVGAEEIEAAGAQPCAFEDLLGQADLVSLHVPLLPGTRHLIDSAALARMKPGAILVNAARGGIVDEQALCIALREGKLGGAALDVFEHEPLGPEHAGLFDNVPSLILTPHIAGVTRESNVRVSALIADTIMRAMNYGEP